MGEVFAPNAEPRSDLTDIAGGQVASSMSDGRGGMIYHIHSSVLGKVVTELNAQGQKAVGYVFAGGEAVAKQNAQGVQSIEWQHVNPLTGSRATSDANRFAGIKAETDPLGVDVGFADPFATLDTGYIEPETPALLPEVGGGGCSSWNPNCVKCSLDGFDWDCADVMSRMETGAAVAAPVWTTVRITYTSGRVQTYSDYTSLPAGLNLRFTGQAAQSAAAGFMLGMGGGLISNDLSRFELGVRASIDFGFGARATFGSEAGRAEGSLGSSLDWRTFANFLTDPAPTTEPQQLKQNDCLTFADMVDKIAANHDLYNSSIAGGGVSRFMDELVSTFTEFRGASELQGGMARIAGFFGGTTNERQITGFGSEGFKPDLYEPPVRGQNGRTIPSNQVRHATGGLMYGYIYGVRGLKDFNARENRNDRLHGVPDINLNNLTVPMGAMIARHQIHARGLGKWIRENLCN